VLEKENVYTDRLCRDKKSRLNYLSNKMQIHVECLNFRKLPVIQVCIKSLLAYKHLLRENYVEYKHIFC